MGFLLRRYLSAPAEGADIPVATGTSHWLEADGPLHYVDYGGRPDGPVLLAVHGLGGSAINWDLVAPHLLPYARLLAVDLPGHGRTPGWGRSTSVHANQRIVNCLIEEVIGGPVILLGNSMGGLISVLQATEHPDTTRGLVLVSPALPLAGVTLSDARALAEFGVLISPGLGRLIVGAWGRLSTAELQVERMLRLVMVDPSSLPEEAIARARAEVATRRHLRNTGRDLVEAARSVIATVFAPDYGRRLQSLHVPVLLVHGTHDRLVSVRSAAAAHQRNPHWRLEVMEGVGHVPQIEAPQQVAEMVLEWLGHELPGSVDLRRPDASTPRGTVRSGTLEG